MIILETVSTIDDAMFDKLFGHSIEDMDAGSYPWHLFPSVETFAQKRDFIRAAYERLLVDGIVWQMFVDDTPCMLNAGVKEGSIIKWLLGLVGPDASGSKSYLYSQDWVDARSVFWDQVGVTGWTLETAGVGTPVDIHLKNRQASNTVGATMTSKEKDLFVTKTLDLQLVR